MISENIGSSTDRAAAYMIHLKYRMAVTKDTLNRLVISVAETTFLIANMISATNLVVTL